MAALKESILRDISYIPESADVDSVEKGLCTAQAAHAWHESPTEGCEQEGRKEDADRRDRRSRATLQQVFDEGQRIDWRYLSDGDLIP